MNGQRFRSEIRFNEAVIPVREFNGTLVYFSTLITYRCAITEVRYGLNGSEPLTRYDMPACDANKPFDSSISSQARR